MKVELMATALGLSATVFAGPAVISDSVSLTQDAATRKATITYTLAAAEPAIVTVDIQTNTQANAQGDWVSIGGANLGRMSGDVNKAMPAGASGTVTWQADAAWPGHLTGARAVVTAWATNAPPDYMALDLSLKTRRFYASAEEVPFGVQDRRYQTDVLLMRKIPAAGIPWRMGAGSSDECGKSAFEGDELPHEVTLSADYYFGVYPLTQRQYLLIHENAKGSYPDVPGGKSPSSYKGADADVHPVEHICYTYLRGGSSWPGSGHDIADGDKGRMIGRARSLTGVLLDLPTEAQWEFAARGGVGSAYADGTSVWKDSLGWTSDNADYDGNTRAVGQGIANNWGIYDMHGNVWEVCLDWWDPSYYSTSPTENPVGPSASTNYRVTRGGGYSSPSTSARLSKRGYAVYNQEAVNLGVRLACPAVVLGE